MTIHYSLRVCLRRHAYEYRAEPFKLKSGKLSNHYVNVRSVLLDPYILDYAASIVASLIEARYKPYTVAGVMMGAAALVTAVSQKLHIPATWVRPEAKTHGQKTRVDVCSQLAQNLRRATPLECHVVLLEDVTTTGGSVLAALQALSEMKLTPIAVITLVDREEGAQEAITKTGVDFACIFTLQELAGKQPI